MLRGQKLIVHLTIDKTNIHHFLSFNLSQEFNNHHSFELKIEHGKLGLPGLINLNDYRKYLGTKLLIAFGYEEAKLNYFSGVITHIALSQSDGFQGVVVFTGYSPTILLDRGADLGSYLDNTLEFIVRKISKNVQYFNLPFNINPKYGNFIDYLIQYKESDFDFLNRLSATYYEWFYYDGEEIHFGRPDELPEGILTYGQEISSLDYGIGVDAVRHNEFFYNAKEDQIWNVDGNVEINSHPDLEHAFIRSKELFSKTYSQVAQSRIENFSDITNRTRYEEKSRISQLLKLNATSDSPLIRLGTVIRVDTSVRQDLKFVKDTLGKFLITKVNHHLDGVGRYTNTFEAIISDTEYIPVPHYKKPITALELADVIDNADPLGQGRVKVRFKWECACNEVTDWLRVMTPDAGTSSVIDKNRGMVFIPEKGDQVIVGFEGNNINRPVVIGSIYHGLSGTGGQVDNHIKSIQTRSGNKVVFNDEEGSIFIEDPSGNTYYMDGKKNITVTAPANININAGQDINLVAGENMNISVGNNMNSTIGNNHTVSITQKHQFTADRYKQVVHNDKQIDVGGDLKETSASSSHKAKTGDILIQSAGIAKILGKIDAKLNKG